MTTNSPVIPAPLLATKPGSWTIGLAITWITPSEATPFAFRIFVGHVKTVLRRAGIAGELGGLFGRAIITRGSELLCGFVLATVDVEDRTAGFNAMKQAADELGMLAAAEIAFSDFDEKIWRTVYPDPSERASEPFDRFFHR